MKERDLDNLWDKPLSEDYQDSNNGIPLLSDMPLEPWEDEPGYRYRVAADVELDNFGFGLMLGHGAGECFWGSQIHVHNARAERNGETGDLTHGKWLEIQIRFGFRCAYCNREDVLHLDHFMPIVRGGPTTEFNTVPACRRCNSSKGGLDPFVWLERKGLTEVFLRKCLAAGGDA